MQVKDLDNKSGVGNDLIGEATRAKHLMNMVECEDAHGNTPLSEASSEYISQFSVSSKSDFNLSDEL